MMKKISSSLAAVLIAGSCFSARVVAMESWQQESRPGHTVRLAWADTEELPYLVSPQAGSTLSQPYMQRWRFKWDEPSASEKIGKYHLKVMGSGAPNALIDEMTSDTSYTFHGECSYIPQRSRLDWSWQVRAQFQDGRWSSWAGPWSFDVSPFNRDRLCERCPDARNCRR